MPEAMTLRRIECSTSRSWMVSLSMEREGDVTMSKRGRTMNARMMPPQDKASQKNGSLFSVI